MLSRIFRDLAIFLLLEPFQLFSDYYGIYEFLQTEEFAKIKRKKNKIEIAERRVNNLHFFPRDSVFIIY